MSTTVNISFEEELLLDIDSVAKSESRSRSELLREAARMYIDRKRRWQRIFSYGKALATAKKLSPEDVATEIDLLRKEKNR